MDKTIGSYSRQDKIVFKCPRRENALGSESTPSRLFLYVQVNLMNPPNTRTNTPHVFQIIFQNVHLTYFGTALPSTRVYIITKAIAKFHILQLHYIKIQEIRRYFSSFRDMINNFIFSSNGRPNSIFGRGQAFSSSPHPDRLWSSFSLPCNGQRSSLRRSKAAVA